MKAADVMTTDVVSVSPDMTVDKIAKLFVERRISGVPVVDEGGAVVGMVSEADLLHRRELDTDRRRAWWLEMLTSNSVLAGEYVKSRGRKAADVMARPVISITENAPLADVAELLEARRIKRVPVVRNGKLVGIVTRANLIQGLASTGRPEAAADVDDQAIRNSLLAELRGQKWAEAGAGNVIVSDHVVHLWGYVLSEDERHALRVASENTPGVRSVEDHTAAMPAVEGV
jgi:CBS domain-containing protein